MTTHDNLQGMLVALITPFTADGSAINFTALEAHTNRMIDAGVHGLVPNGSTGEFTSQSPDERKAVIEACVKFADGRVPVVAGTGGLTTREAVEMTRHAAEVGAAAAMVVPPFYDVLRIDELKTYLETVSEAGQLPIMYYNIPGASGLSLTASELASLAEIPRVAYIKDTSGNAPALAELLVKHADDITVFNGWDTLTFVGLASGAKGSVWGAINVIPELAVELWDTVAVRKDLDKGRELWKAIWPICEYLDRFNYAASVKAGVRLVGGTTGPVRAPYHDLTQPDLDHFANLLRNADVDVA